MFENILTKELIICIILEEDISHLTEEDKQYLPRFEERIGEVLNCVHPIDREYVNSLLEDMYDRIMDYSGHWDRKYYKTGFADGIKLILSVLLFIINIC